MEDESPNAISSLNSILTILGRLPEDEQQRVIKSVLTFFGVVSRQTEPPISARPGRTADFSTAHEPSPKEFMLEKQPRTDVERVACLAYYLEHFRNMPHFKTLDLAKLNTEAAQPKFSNTAYAAANAVNTGYLVPSTKGQRQLSAAGEQFVRALPDREAAKAAMSRARPRRLSSRKKLPKERALS